MAFRSMRFKLPGDDAKATRRPASILLDQRVHISNSINQETTLVTAESRDGHAVNLSLRIHEPPALSFFCLRCHKVPDSDSESDDADFQDWAEVVGAKGRFVLLRAGFSCYGGDEYFMYKAASDGEPASLEPMLLPNDHRLPTLDEFGIVPRGRSGHYLVAALCLGMDPMNYLLHTYSSEDQRWRSIRLLNPCPELAKVVTSKVVTLGDGELGWVDFQHGMLVCSNLGEKESPGARYVPLPDPLPENRGRLQKLHPGPSTTRVRDLTCDVNGVIELVEMEHRVVVITEDASGSELLCDSELIMSRKRKRADDGKPKQLVSRDGWKLATWSRTVSCDRWRKGCVVDVDDISIDDESTLSLLLPGLSGMTAQNEAFREVYLAFPTLSSCGDDVVYLKSTEKSSGSKGCLVAVDLAKKTERILIISVVVVVGVSLVCI